MQEFKASEFLSKNLLKLFHYSKMKINLAHATKAHATHYEVLRK